MWLPNHLVSRDQSDLLARPPLGARRIFKIQSHLIFGRWGEPISSTSNFLTKERSMTPYRDINDEEWQRVAPLLPELRPRAELRGRPLANTRAVLNGVLWVMHSGATWSAMPRKYPSYQTCHRRFKA
jgi:hypothetical protein